MAYTYTDDGDICVIASAKVSATDVVRALDHDGLVEFVLGVLEEADDALLNQRVATYVE